MTESAANQIPTSHQARHPPRPPGSISTIVKRPDSELRPRAPDGHLKRASSLRISSPPEELTARVDRYGWRSVSATSGADSDEQTAIEARREKKWLVMTSHWNDFFRRHIAKIHERVRKGIPDRLRGRAWRLILDPDPPADRPSLDALIALGDPACLRVIDADVPRTMPGHAMFEAAALRLSLRRVLHAYANHDPELGYVQGMGFIAAMLLSYLDEPQTLWCFAAVMNGQALQHRRLFLAGFSGLLSLNKAWENLLQSKYPRIAEHFKQIELEPLLYTTGWFLTGFMGLNLHPEIRMRLFDRFIMFGYRALFSFGLLIISSAKVVFLTACAIDCMEALQKPEESPMMNDWRQVIAKYDKKWISVKEYDGCLKKAGVSFS
jgi:hypothetical protein